MLEPSFVRGVADEAEAFRNALRHPIGSDPLSQIIGNRDRIAIAIPDLTRPLPRDRLLPWLLFEELQHIPPENVVIVNGTGTHRANTDDELRAMVGEEVFNRYRIVNHDARDPATLVLAGSTVDGQPVYLNRDYVQADRRIVLGFIEPHFMAGFSGGYKGVFPAVADLESIQHYHRAAVIGDPRSTWGVLDANPTQDQVRANGSLVSVDFLINVTLNRRHEITGYFCGDVLAAHAAGCAFAKRTAMVACPHPFPIVITTNGGFPLDQNLYQAVKGISAAAQVVADGGLIITAAECSDGFPDHGNFRRLLHDHSSPQSMLDTIRTPGFATMDQWQVQLLALILLRSRVGVYSTIAPNAMLRAHMEPIADIAERVEEELRHIGRDAPIAVLPEGPMTIPFLA